MKIELKKPGSVHLVGIGGSGMYYLALLLHFLGWRVSGSDQTENERVKKLKKRGLPLFIGHQPSNLQIQPDFLVVSPAITQPLPEIKAAQKRKIPIYHYHQFLDLIYRELPLIKNQPLIKRALRRSNFAPFYQLDLKQTKIIGITGTDGKTTTTTMINHILKKNGLKSAMITTLGAQIGSKKLTTGLHTTTPPAQELAPIIKKIVEKKITYLALEITSHALAQHRVEGLRLIGAVYTNVTEEHLDFHQTWSQYLQDKARMIDLVKPDGFVVLNRDDRSFRYLKKKAARARLAIFTYGHRQADLVIQEMPTSNQATKAILFFQRKRYLLHLPIIGRYNLANASAAILAAYQLGVALKNAVDALADFPGVTGRMTILQRQPFTLIVDFAHTPNGLKQALASARKLIKNQGRLLVVFGAAGLRDPFKRPKMGKIAAELAEILVLAPEDPRREKTAQINQAIIAGIESKKIVFSEENLPDRLQVEQELNQGKKVIICFNQDRPQGRENALAWAVKNSRRGDVVIACGKGHEKSLCFGQREYPWDEIAILKRIILK